MLFLGGARRKETNSEPHSVYLGSHQLGTDEEWYCRDEHRERSQLRSFNNTRFSLKLVAN